MPGTRLATGREVLAGDHRLHVELAWRLIVDLDSKWIVVSTEGEVDVASADELERELTTLIDGGDRHVVVDLSDVEFIDSLGIGCLVAAWKRARAASGDLRIVCSDERLLLVFSLTEIDALIDIFPTLEGATS